MVTWPMTSRDLERSNSWPQYALITAQYLENGWRQRLRSKGPPIGNDITVTGYQMVSKGAVSVRQYGRLS